jgi:DNA invertase Pin-like site-specific DNA recombinase
MTVVIYARQSLDRTGEEFAVDRQLAECRAFAAERGLAVDLELKDNDISATSGKVRPAFERLLDLRPTTIITWHQDRLLRLTKDLERVIALNVPVLTVKSGSLDLATPAGRAVARTVAAWSQYEGEQKSLRQIASNKQRAERGAWQFSIRPYGYGRVPSKPMTDEERASIDPEQRLLPAGSIYVVESEAAVLREAFARYAAGETYYAITTDLNARGIPTLKGGTWTISQLRDRLRNPAYAALLYYKGTLVGEGDWEPIIDRVSWQRFDGVRSGRAVVQGWTTKTKYLLSGLAICGVCGSAMRAHGYKGKRRTPTEQPKLRMTYGCFDGFCTARDLVKVDALVERVLLGRLSRDDARQLLTPTVDTEPILTEVKELHSRLSDLAALMAEGHLSAAAVREQSPILRDRITQLEDQLQAADGSPVGQLIGADDIAARWAELPLRAKRLVLSSLLTVTINQQGKGGIFDPEAIEISWK